MKVSTAGSTADLLDVVFPDRPTPVRCRLRGYVAPGRHRGEFHMGHAALLRLQQAFEVLNDDVDVVPYEVDDEGYLLVDVRFQVAGVWHDLVESLLREGWGMAWDGQGDPPKFDLDNYPIRQDP